MTQQVYDFYVAMRYRNKTTALTLAGALRDRGYAVYCFAESGASATHLGPATTETFLDAVESWVPRRGWKFWRKADRLSGHVS